MSELYGPSPGRSIAALSDEQADALICRRSTCSRLIYPDSPGLGVQCPGDSDHAWVFTAAARCCYLWPR